MSSGTASRHQHHGHDHAHDGSHSHGGAACCGAGSASGGASSINRPPATGRSFRVTGLDCAEEVAALNKVVGPELGGPAHLAFDVLNGRMTVPDRDRPLSDEKTARLVGGTGLRDPPWQAQTAPGDR